MPVAAAARGRRALRPPAGPDGRAATACFPLACRERYFFWESVTQVQTIIMVIAEVFSRTLPVFQQALLLEVRPVMPPSEAGAYVASGYQAGLLPASTGRRY